MTCPRSHGWEVAQKGVTQGPEPPLVLLPESNPSYPTLSQEGGKFKETRKSPEQVYFSFDKFCTEYITSGVLSFHQKTRSYLTVMPNGSDGGRETSRKLPVLRERIIV